MTYTTTLKVVVPHVGARIVIYRHPSTMVGAMAAYNRHKKTGFFSVLPCKGWVVKDVRMQGNAQPRWFYYTTTVLYSTSRVGTHIAQTTSSTPSAPTNTPAILLDSLSTHIICMHVSDSESTMIPYPITALAHPSHTHPSSLNCHV